MVATVAIVWPCPDGVEAYAAAGRAVVVPRPGCPRCDRPMIFWAGYPRFVRAHAGRLYRVWVRRAKCPSCRVTHALLPAFVLLGRVDVVEVIGAVLDRAVAGAGLRPVAHALGVPHSTARDWRRRFRARAPALAAGLAALAVEFGGVAPVLPAEPEAAALVALGAAWAWACQRRQRSGGPGGQVPGRWGFAAVASGGGWLAATTPPPWAGPGGRRWLAPVPWSPSREAPCPHPNPPIASSRSRCSATA